ncbi:MAG: XrtA/PEP-CTERM system histidine kinase PrsK [Thermodesulfobacteriota bacterium]
MNNFGLIISFGAGALSLGIAIFVLLKDYRSFQQRVFASGMIAFALEAIFTGFSLQTPFVETIIRWQRVRLIIEGFIPPIWLLFSVSFAKENYKESIKRMRWPLILFFIIPLIFGIGLNKAIIRDVVIDESSKWIVTLGRGGQFFYIIIIIITIIVLMNLERTFRISRGHIRWQIKFMIIGLGGLFALRIYTGGQTLMFRAVDMELEIVNSGALIVANALILRSLFRLNILSIQFYPSQAVLYSSFTLLLAGIYFIIVGVLVNLFKYFNGGQAIALRVFFVFLAFVGLFVLLFSDRVRHKIKYFISIHFKRHTYDYRKEWMKFTKETSLITDSDTLCMKVAKMLSTTLEVLSVTIWLFDETYGRLRASGSTVFSANGIGHRISDEVGTKLIQMFKDQEGPIDLDDSKISWAEDLKQSIHETFQEARIRYCIRLSAGGQFLGIITLGERVGYESFSFDEFDLLKTIADQIAVSLLNLKISEELRKAKEMEAFRTISAFMIHDLKNMASTLSLTMQNLPIHFENPEFREDALRIIQQSVNKINHMCGQLSFLSKKIELNKVATDLNELVLRSLSSINGGRNVSMTHDLLPISKIFIDPEQIQKVITNLIINAREALINGGLIHIKTFEKENWAILSVSDNGCGMSKEFMERSLFKPFKTTKKQGMGIGLYQSKTIVEAHGGRIEVESQQGKGSTFRVFLPLKQNSLRN